MNYSPDYGLKKKRKNKSGNTYNKCKTAIPRQELRILRRDLELRTLQTDLELRTLQKDLELRTLQKGILRKNFNDVIAHKVSMECATPTNFCDPPITDPVIFPYVSNQTTPYRHVKVPSKLIIYLPQNMFTKEKLFFKTESKLLSPLKNSNAVIKYNRNYTQNEWHKFLLCIQYVYESIRRLLKSRKICDTIQKVESFAIVTIDLPKLLTTHFCVKNNETINFKNYGRRITENNRLMITYPKELCTIPKSDRSCNDIFVRHRSIKIQMSLSKYQAISEESVTILEILCDLSNKLITKHEEVKNVPSLYGPNWYIRSMAQGYLIWNLFKSANVNKLNVMRKFYYIIITSFSSNLNVQINFQLKNGIFVVYENKLFIGFCEENISWNHDHEKTYDSYTMNGPNLNSHHRYRLRNLEAIAYKKLSDSHSNVSSPSCTAVEDGTANCISLFSSDSTGNITCEVESTNGINESLVSMEDLLMQYNNVLDTHYAAGDSIINRIFQRDRNIYCIHLLHSKKWLSKILIKTKEKVDTTKNLNIPNDLFNETIFEFSISKLLNPLADVCSKHITEEFCKSFLKSLGMSIVNNLFSSML